MEIDKIYNCDCLVGLQSIEDESVELVLTDIPYNECNRSDNGLRNLNKKDADIGNFDLVSLTQTLCDKARGSVYMFCGIEQVSTIRKTMREKGLSTRVVVWEKTNPSPMNGQHIWLSGIELCVYGKKKGAKFNEFCKNTVFRFPNGRSKIHPTQKPVPLFETFILASTEEGDTVLDPFMGSGTTAVACLNTKRHYIGFELNKEYYEKAEERIGDLTSQGTLF